MFVEYRLTSPHCIRSKNADRAVHLRDVSCPPAYDHDAQCWHSAPFAFGASDGASTNAIKRICDMLDMQTTDFAEAARFEYVTYQNFILENATVAEVGAPRARVASLWMPVRIREYDSDAGDWTMSGAFMRSVACCILDECRTMAAEYESGIHDAGPDAAVYTANPACVRRAVGVYGFMLDGANPPPFWLPGSPDDNASLISWRNPTGGSNGD